MSKKWSFSLVLFLFGEILLASWCGAYAASYDPIAFVSDKTGATDIWTLDPSTGERVNLTKDPYDDSSPAFDPTHIKVAYTSYREGRFEIWQVTLSGQKKECLVSYKMDAWHPSWSPDGNRIVFAASDGLHISDLQKGKILALATGDYDTPFWLPNSNKIVAVRNEHEKDSPSPIQYIEIIDSLTLRKSVVLEIHGSHISSPTGLKEDDIVFVSNAFGAPRIIRKEGSGVKDVLEGKLENVDHPSFSHSGKYIVFSMGSGSEENLWMATAGGPIVRQLTSSFGNCSEPSF